MKICLFSSVYALSEDDKHAAFLVESNRHLLEQGHEVHVLAPSFEGLKSHVIKGVKVHRFRYFFAKWEHLTHGEGAPNRVQNIFYLMIAAFYILFGTIAAIRLCRKEKFDLIHVHWPFPHAIWGWAAKLVTGVPMVLVFHGAELLLSKRFPFVNPVLKFFIKRSEALLCNSSYTAGQLRKITNKKVNIIPYGCSIDVKEGVETESTENESEVPEKHILFVGRLIERKGLPYLIRAMDSIVKQRPHDRIMLHIVGTGPEQCMVDELVASLKLSPHIVFHGVVSDEDLVSLYRSADVFVLPSIMDKKGDTEGLGVVLVEAMSFLTPVVASDVGGISDVVISEKTGMLVPEKAPQALAEAIIKILDDESFAKELTENALSHVQGYFDWQRIVNEVIKISKEAQCGLEMSR